MSNSSSQAEAKTNGLLALVGSGEYLPIMSGFEAKLLLAGNSQKYVQLATAAGQESDDRLHYWQKVGQEQGDRIGADVDFIPVFTRDDANNPDFAARIDGAGLIYLSGGNPSYLAATLKGTLVWEAIERNWRSGSSLAGCSAGAMAMHDLGVIPHIRVIPHYDKYFRWFPDAAARIVAKIMDGVWVIGIDEKTAIFTSDQREWEVVGSAKVHLLHGGPAGKYESGSKITL